MWYTVLMKIHHVWILKSSRLWDISGPIVINKGTKCIGGPQKQMAKPESGEYDSPELIMMSPALQ